MQILGPQSQHLYNWAAQTKTTIHFLIFLPVQNTKHNYYWEPWQIGNYYLIIHIFIFYLVKKAIAAMESPQSVSQKFAPDVHAGDSMESCKTRFQSSPVTILNSIWIP